MIRFVKKMGNRVAMEIYPYYPTQPDKTHEHLMLDADDMTRLDAIRIKYLGNPLLPVDNMPCPYDPSILKDIEPLMNKYTIIERGCTAGNRALCIQADGDVVPCNYLRVKLGNIFETTIMDIYNNNPIVAKLRNREVTGRCGNCKHRIECGGCRTRAKLETGDMFGGIISCQSSVDGHILEDVANKMLKKASKKYKREIKLFEIYSKIKNTFNKKQK
jgi:radical SAM protein with 4Fe4S-binding SPASM domain